MDSTAEMYLTKNKKKNITETMYEYMLTQHVKYFFIASFILPLLLSKKARKKKKKKKGKTGNLLSARRPLNDHSFYFCFSLFRLFFMAVVCFVLLLFHLFFALLACFIGFGLSSFRTVLLLLLTNGDMKKTQETEKKKKQKLYAFMWKNAARKS